MHCNTVKAATQITSHPQGRAAAVIEKMMLKAHTGLGDAPVNQTSNRAELSSAAGCSLWGFDVYKVRLV